MTFYDSMHYHRTEQGLGKSLWSPSIQLEQECEIFEKAFVNQWQCEDGHLWSFGDDIQGRQILGQKGERIAQFKQNAANNPWHGLPKATEPKSPPVSFLRKWMSDNVISRTFGKRLLKNQL